MRHDEARQSSPSPVSGTGSPRSPHPSGSASWQNFREWVEVTLNVFLAPHGLVATDETIDTFAQVLECRAKELAAAASKAAKCVIGEYCAQHDFIHGKEAEELRQRIEKMAAETRGRFHRQQLQELLDDVDARDSCAYVAVLASCAGVDVAGVS